MEERNMEQNKDFIKEKTTYKRVPVIIDDKSCKKYENILEQIKESDKITDIEYPMNSIRYYIEDDETYVKIKIHFENDKKQSKFLKYDDYFKLISADVWDNPELIDDEAIPTKTKMDDAAPYNVFFNTLKYLPETRNRLDSVRFIDLLCPSLGKLKCCLHITFLAQIDWILSNYALKNLHNIPMTIIHGYEEMPWPKDQTMQKLYPNIDYYYVKKKEEKSGGVAGIQHSKMSLFVYDDDSIRIAIGSVNLFAGDWDLYNQLLWISPRCPKLPESSSFIKGESPTGFKSALLGCLHGYKALNISNLSTWIARVESADFQDIKVSLLYSVPGVHLPRRNGCALHFLGHLLSHDCTIPAPKREHDSWRVIVQTAALGFMGNTKDEWLTTTILKSLGSHVDSKYLPTLRSVAKVDFSLIYPTTQDCLDGLLGPKSADCCGCEKRIIDLQHWLLQYQCQWRANGTKRTRAISHSKCYCRVSPCFKKMAYFFLTSSNFSRSGWGTIPRSDSSIFVRSHELGVLFLPKYFGEEYFEIKDCPERKNRRLFPMLFDLPLTPYGPQDMPYCGEELSATSVSDSDDSDGASAKPREDTKMAFEKMGEKLNNVLDKFDKLAVSIDEQEQPKPPILVQKDIGKSDNLFFPSFK